MKKNPFLHALLDLGLFVAAAFGTHVAQSYDRPITAVLVFLLGVIAIAVHSGLATALLAAVAASLIFNFFLSEPAFQFGITTADAAVPLLAFNITAVLTGALVGRLKDSVNKTRISQEQTAFLLTISERLQRAYKVEQVETEMRDILTTRGVTSFELHLAQEDALVRPHVGDDEPNFIEQAKSGDGTHTKSVLLKLDGVAGQLGVAKFGLEESDTHHTTYSDLRSICSLLELAVERCLLLEQLAEARAIARSDELKDTILSSISHDLRTPLTAIETAASALNSTQVDLPAQDREALLNSIVEQCHRLDRYTAELLDVSRIQAGISNSDLQLVNLAEILSMAISNAKAAYPEAEITRESWDEEVCVTASAAMLGQAVFNVLENACQIAGQFGPISVRLVHQDGEAQITIADCGPGVAAPDRQRLFDRFFRDDKSRDRYGSGLGLYIARGFVEAFDGSIAIEDRDDGSSGAQFVIRLPFVSFEARPEPAQ